MARQMPLPASASHVVPGPQERPLRIAIFDNLANSAYIQAKAMRRLGQAADLVLDPLDDYAMSDPRWEDLDLELPNDKLFAPSLPPADLPDWVRSEPPVENHRQGGRIERNAGLLRQAPSTWPAGAERGWSSREPGSCAHWRGTTA